MSAVDAKNAGEIAELGTRVRALSEDVAEQLAAAVPEVEALETGDGPPELRATAKRLRQHLQAAGAAVTGVAAPARDLYEEGLK